MHNGKATTSERQNVSRLKAIRKVKKQFYNLILLVTTLTIIVNEK